MRVLITGFQTSKSHPVNTSYEVKNALNRKVGKVEIIPEDMIGNYHTTIPYMEKLIEKYNPDAFICMGQALRREVISLEKIGINYQNEERDWALDDDGFLPKHRTIVERGADGYFTNLPILKMLEALKKEEYPSEISLTAGAIGCNNALYCIMHLINTKYPKMMGGFIHVPSHHQHPRRLVKSFDVEYLARGVETALKVLGE
ncbi:pyrrolidone-carboxylate peptidase (5-oxoprolyl-peptidase) (Pyroglutamyl-peptidase I) (PGP-I) (Pyrase) [Treponema primitia ZAS-2]|uniref:Pyrrolidone-carboxylate peptidase n=1 Tax=Treponema primitia (strain ATCC BAA-887 / DSM 12427 / ZAS-2) TaxID=545694 RepID=F5YI61_TREPZ|nr:pyrrolidone-carboxylate peptidase [Treponema primitia]AEF85053.1 pyrrolidone-carboxylate peptidase (5-oxoprolyl-peptidase) (Pyroglutamyl-peptidase I) (PGP-I) (Pyrase) [Treponema primitia ZAS-2]